jgi:hypothetical protein
LEANDRDVRGRGPTISRSPRSAFAAADGAAVPAAQAEASHDNSDAESDAEFEYSDLAAYGAASNRVACRHPDGIARSRA